MIQNRPEAVNLHQVVSNAIDALSAPAHDQRSLFGAFLRMKLEKRQWSREQFAQKLGLPIALTELVLDGDIPDWFISDTALERIASLLEEEPVVVMSMLGRMPPVSPLSVDEVAELLADE